MPIYQSIIRPMLFKMPSETVHEAGIETLKVILGSEFAQNLASERFESDQFGILERFGLSFRNPLGMAAGFDKNGVVVNQLACLGFGFVEVGTITYEAQQGNERPRLFRLEGDGGLINRLGFNNDGARKVLERLEKIDRKCVIGVNVGKNKDISIEDAAENYLKSFELACEVADYVAVNISSPNTPKLRELQKADNLEGLLKALQKRNTSNTRNEPRVPILVKIAPDLSDSEIEMIVDICFRNSISGMIATNTTTARENLISPSEIISQHGGLSGKPLAKRSNEVISAIYRFSRGKMPIVGVGGIFSAHDAFEKIQAGASLLQAYTGFVYQGPTFARDVNSGLANLLRERGFETLDDAIGSSAFG